MDVSSIDESQSLNVFSAPAVCQVLHLTWGTQQAPQQTALKLIMHVREMCRKERTKAHDNGSPCDNLTNMGATRPFECVN